MLFKHCPSYKLFSTYANMKLKCKTIQPTGKNHSATVIFFHGSGDTGHNLIEWVRFLLGRDMEFPHIKIIYPTAPVQNYTLFGGEPSNVWFDRKSLDINSRESRASLAAIYEDVGELLKAEIDAGIPANRIVVGGFSMGGALAMHTGYHINQELGGVFACSAFLNNNSIVYDSIKNKTSKNGVFPELKMFHGERDTLVLCEWGKTTYDQLTDLGIKAEFTTLKNTLHELKKKEMQDISEWLLKILPAEHKDLQNKL